MKEISVHWRLSSPYGCGQKETPRKMENKHLVSFSRQCSNAPVGFGWGLISKEHCNDTHFYLFLDWHKHCRDGVFVMLLTSFRMRLNIYEKLLQKASRTVSNIFTVAGGSLDLHKGLFWRECSLNICAILCFSETKWFRVRLEAATYYSTLCPRGGQVTNKTDIHKVSTCCSKSIRLVT
jgi:hypothetical protein